MIKSYYGLLKSQKLMTVAEKNLEMSEQQVSIVNEKFDLGVIKRSDLLKAQVAQGQAKVDVLNKRITLENSRRNLFNDMGLQDFGQTINAIDEDWVMPAIPSSSQILDLLRTQNPSILISHRVYQLLHKVLLSFYQDDKTEYLDKISVIKAGLSGSNEYPCSLCSKKSF